MRKLFSSILIVFILFINFVIPFFVFAATPTISLSLFSENQNSQTGKWSWGLPINTTNIADGAIINIDIYKNGVKDTATTIVSIKSNYGEYLTGSVLDSSTIYKIVATYQGATNTFQKTTPTGITPNLIINGTTPTPVTQTPVLVTPKQNTTVDDGSYTLLAPIGKLLKAPDNIGDYFNVIFQLAIGLCAVLAVVMIVISGIQYMGDESIFSKTEAKSKITAAVLGLLIALGSYALLNTINPALLGGGGVNISQVSVNIVNLPDAGDSTVDPKCKQGNATYSTNTPVSAGVTSAIAKIKQGWSISGFRVYTNNRMLINLKKGGEVDNTNLINILPGTQNYSDIGKAEKMKTPKGTWKILSMKTPGDGKSVCNGTGSNMGASFWLLNPTTNGERGIGMHGNGDGTLSKTAGCVRLTNADLLALLPYVSVGTPVLIAD